ncbi:hypothetical protein B0A48_07880 [Cryoendolithus antarcticus]|uniref:DNA-directed RNA polymerases I, II, and III subunit RPABC4 n=1 Tax=Cryoendolithus antarcticus TaxID=1507870 RepID=A0A1V8T0C2_9PEZI|nr:hypothetical protein B0A48_07880 [Cryoendolithus antarcticus]OQO27092.1 hypothetical protein B0A51_05858 [Rachicladosporium sp. CCFEE 5018]OQO31674.1 hypothetical protein B0A51_01164 [Rachicladosporium sp. CCFEE 5018]
MASRDEYVPPTSSSSQNFSGTTGTANTGFASSSANPSTTIEDSSAKPVNYLCGDCDNKVALKRGDPIRCKECGYRVLYKERTSRIVQFEAR